MNSNNGDLNDAFFFNTHDIETKKINSITEALKDILDIIGNKTILMDNNLYEEFVSIANKISYIPSVADILQLHITNDEKKSLIEKLLLLIHLPVMSVEFFELKNIIEYSIDQNRTLIEYNRTYNKDSNKVIQYENILKSLTNEIILKPIEYRIYDMDIADHDKIYLYKRYKSLTSYGDKNPSYTFKVNNWIDIIFSLPTMNKQLVVNNIKDYIIDVRKKLDMELYGLTNVKEKLIMLLHKRLINSTNHGTNIALAGPPGVAKTTIINKFAQIINIPFFQINAASIKELGFLIGHNFTYENSGPGCIVQALIKLGYKNGIIYFDEFDKIPANSEISKSLLHIIDSSQNSKFYDQYIGERFNIDLSQIWFIYSINDRNNVDKTLIDRINVVDIDGYTINEQVGILKDHILPRLLRENNLPDNSIIIDFESMEYIVKLSHEKITKEQRKGVRQSYQVLNDIINKISFLCTMSDTNSDDRVLFSFHMRDITLPLKLKKSDIDDLLAK